MPTCASLLFSFNIDTRPDCTPYLLSLGLTKGQTSIVWLAGPLSGLIVQPVMGVISDQSTSKYGRRRPFIIGGSLIVSLGLMVLGFTKEIVTFFVSDASVAPTLTIILAAISLYTVDFALNAVMSCWRSLMVDVLPVEKQQSGAAWASRMDSTGKILAYAAGAIDLVGISGNFLGNTQFKKLTVIGAISISSLSALTCWAVTERVLLSRPSGPKGSGSGLDVVRKIWATLRTLPPRMQGIVWALFWSWVGWYPFMIYSSTWVGETYFRYDAPKDAVTSSDALGDMGRVGSFALAVYSAITFLGAWVLPLLVQSPDQANFTQRPPQALAPFLERLNNFKPSLLTIWFWSHLMFSTAMFLAPFAASFRFATALVAFCGVPWAVTTWAPVALMGVEVNKLAGAGATMPYRRLSNGSSVEMDVLNLEHGSQPDDNTTTAKSSGELSGAYFGIMNIYVVIPQFLVTFMSTIVFAIMEPGKSSELASGETDPAEHASKDGPNAIAVCLFIGALSSLGAAYATRRLKALHALGVE